MNRIEILEKEWMGCFTRMRQGRFFQLLTSKRLERTHYMGFLRETYHNASHNPKNMALFMAHLHSDRRQLEAKFLKHTAAEIGHDELALDDLKILGGDAESVRTGRPLPTTEALAAFIVFQIQHRNPLAYLGYLYHLEAMPVHFGKEVMECLLAAGIPLEATTFLREHAEADPVHVKWNREYLEGFIRNDEDMEAVLYGLRGTCELHGGMFQGILDHGQDWMAVPAPRAESMNSHSAESPSQKALKAP
jgi:pyrroloquinoline quinone (PQQ) biosynthesis protein C